MPNLPGGHRQIIAVLNFPIGWWREAWLTLYVWETGNLNIFGLENFSILLSWHSPGSYTPWKTEQAFGFQRQGVEGGIPSPSVCNVTHIHGRTNVSSPNTRSTTHPTNEVHLSSKVSALLMSQTCHRFFSSKKRKYSYLDCFSSGTFLTILGVREEKTLAQKSGISSVMNLAMTWLCDIAKLTVLLWASLGFICY